MYLESIGEPASAAQDQLCAQGTNPVSISSDHIDINDYLFDQQSVAPIFQDGVDGELLMDPLEKVPAKARTAALNRQSKGSNRQHAANGYVVRDTFSMPTKDYSVIEVLRIRLAKEGYICSKSEVIRAGLLALNSMHENELIERIRVVEKIKMGRKT